MLFAFFQSVAVFLFVVGAVQALLLLLALRRKDGPPTLSARLLAGLLVCITAVLLHHALFVSLPPDLPLRYLGNGLAAACWFAIPPLYLAFVRSSVNPLVTLSRPRDYHLFFPSAYHLVSWLAAGFGWYLPWGEWLGDYAVLYLYVWVGGYVVMGLWCTVLAARILARPQVRSKDKKAMFSSRQTEFGWLRAYTHWFILALLITGGILIGLALTNRYHVSFEYSLLAVFAAFTISLAYRSIRHPATATRLTNRLYGDAAVAAADLPALHEKLDTYVRDQCPYLRPDLRRADLAAATGLSEHDLSQVFGRYLNTNFYAYINTYRLAAFETRLTDGSLEQLTVAALAQSCGFKSKTSLYRVFREKHGMTPGEYLKQRRLVN